MRRSQQKRRMRGMSMLEALVSVLLTSILGLGITYTIARASVAQLTMNVNGLSINGMRSLLQHGTCLSSGSTIPVGASSIGVACTQVVPTYTYNISYGGAAQSNGSFSLPNINTLNGLSSYYGGTVTINSSQ
jgi:Tfp pilus assembly protein PilV